MNLFSVAEAFHVQILAAWRSDLLEFKSLSVLWMLEGWEAVSDSLLERGNQNFGGVVGEQVLQ